MLVFYKVFNKRLREQGLSFLKIKEFTCVNDCFQKRRNAVIGVSLLTLIPEYQY